MENRKQITIGALLSYITIAFNIIMGLLYTPWMIKTIGDDQYALYTLAVSIINIFLIDFGINSSVNKFLSNYYAKKQYEKAECFLGIVYKVYLVISLIIAFGLIIYYLLIEQIYINLTITEINVFKHLFIIVAVYSVLSFPFSTFNGILMANERFIEIKICNLGEKVFGIAVIIFSLMKGHGVYTLVLVHALSNLIFTFLKYYFIKSKTSQRTNFLSWNKDIAKNIFNYSVWITVMNVSQRCIFNIMPTMIAATIGSKEVTLFSLAAVLESYVYTFADSINGMFMPKISRILTMDNIKEKLTDLMIKVGRFHIYTIGLLFIGFLCIGREFIVCWMGSEYELVYILTIWLILPSLLYIPQQVAKTALLAKGTVKAQAIIYIIMAILNICLSAILLPKMGIIGAAISICVAYFVRTLGLNILYYCNLEIDLKKYYIKVYGRWICLAVITLLFGKYILNFKKFTGWSDIIIKAVLISIVYFSIGLVFFYKQIIRKLRQKEIKRNYE